MVVGDSMRKYSLRKPVADSCVQAMMSSLLLSASTTPLSLPPGQGEPSQSIAAWVLP